MPRQGGNLRPRQVQFSFAHTILHEATVQKPHTPLLLECSGKLKPESPRKHWTPYVDKRLHG